MKPTTPVTVIGGYLGAGKTTLVNELLRGDHGRRLAVLVNDYGSVNLDVDLIEEHNGQTISLTNGCICCSIADSLADSLDEVLALDPPPDQIVIEASGVADPGTVASYGMGWPGCRLDAVVVLADAETIRRQSTDQFVGELVVRQLARADVVVLTKTDLVSAEFLAATLLWVAAQTTAPVVTTSHVRGGLDPRLVLDIDDDASAIEPLPSITADALFTSELLAIDQPIERETLDELLATLDSRVVRAKGILQVIQDGTVTSQLVQVVGNRTTVEPGPGRATPSPGLVIIKVA